MLWSLYSIIIFEFRNLLSKFVTLSHGFVVMWIKLINYELLMCHVQGNGICLWLVLSCRSFFYNWNLIKSMVMHHNDLNVHGLLKLMIIIMLLVSKIMVMHHDHLYLSLNHNLTLFSYHLHSKSNMNGQLNILHLKVILRLFALLFILL